MLKELLPKLREVSIILASSSPRRRDIMSYLGLNFTVMASNFPEDLDKSKYMGRPEDYVKDNARLKALDVSEKLQNNSKSSHLIIGSDTVVVLDGQIIEKPRDSAHAKAILQKLSKRTHTVYTGVALILKRESNEDCCSFFAETAVTFPELTQPMIDKYVATGEPLDKAGAYGIQGYGALLVSKIEGDYYNVVGLPLQRLSQELIKIFS